MSDQPHSSTMDNRATTFRIDIGFCVGIVSRGPLKSLYRIHVLPPSGLPETFTGARMIINPKLASYHPKKNPNKTITGTQTPLKGALVNSDDAEAGGLPPPRRVPIRRAFAASVAAGCALARCAGPTSEQGLGSVSLRC